MKILCCIFTINQKTKHCHQLNDPYAANFILYDHKVLGMEFLVSCFHPFL